MNDTDTCYTPLNIINRDAVDLMEILMYYLSSILVMAFSFLPAIFAFKNYHPKRWLIFWVNLVLNSIGIGWIVAGILYFKFKNADESVPEQDIEKTFSETTDSASVPFCAFTLFLKLCFLASSIGVSLCWLVLLKEEAGVGTVINLMAAAVVLISLVEARLNQFAVIAGIIMGVLGFLGLIMVIVVSTIGTGSIRLAGSEITFALALGFLAAFGFASLFWKNNRAQK